MLKKLILVGLLASASIATGALAGTPSKLNGTWILDAKETENYVVGSPLPLNARRLAEWFGLASGYMCLFTYEFEGEIASVSGYNSSGKSDSDKKMEYQFLSHQGSEIKYTLKNTKDLPAKTLSVFILNDENIKIIHSDNPEMGYLLWKHGQLKTGQATHGDFKAAMEAWLASLQKIQKVLNASPNPAVNSEASQHPGH